MAMPKDGEAPKKGKEKQPEAGRRLSYRYRIYPTAAQRRYFAVNFGCCRYVYNHFLSEREAAYLRTCKTVKVPKLDESGERVVGEDGKGAWDEAPNPLYVEGSRPMSHFDATKALTVLKKETVGEDGRRWLYDADATALVYSLRHLDAAYKHFFRRVKQASGPAGHPKFKSRRDPHPSFTLARCKVGDGCVVLPKVGEVKAKIHRPLQGEIVSATVTMDIEPTPRHPEGAYSIAVNVKEAPFEEYRAPEGGAVGVTMGLERWIVTSDGEVRQLPEEIKRLERQLAREQRRLSRRQGARKGEAASNRYLEQRRKVARIQARIANIRKDAVHNATAELVREHAAVYTRAMGGKDMMQSQKGPGKKRRAINRRIADASFAEVNRQIAYKAEWAGRRHLELEVLAPTAQTCSDCGHVEKSVADSFSQTWTCPECGRVHDRKYNGARNVLEAGLRIDAERGLEGGDAE